MGTQIANKEALGLCKQGSKTLIFSKKDDFIPSIQQMCELRKYVYFTETNEYSETVERNFENFDCFIFVGKNLNSFERKFFQLLEENTNKKIIALDNKND